MKNRLVGAIVLGCLAIIFIPIILDGEGVKTPEMSTNIPPAPVLPAPPQIEPERPQIIADELAEVEVVDAVAAEVEIEGKPRLNSQGLPGAWSVRLASFSQSANADTLVKRLLRKGYKAYSRLLNSSQGKLTVVYVGPVLTRLDADTLLDELEHEFNLKGLAVKFSIDEMTH